MMHARGRTAAEACATPLSARCQAKRDRRFTARAGTKRRDSPYRSGRSRDWIWSKNPNAPAMMRETEEDWGRSAR